MIYMYLLVNMIYPLPNTVCSQPSMIIIAPIQHSTLLFSQHDAPPTQHDIPPTQQNTPLPHMIFPRPNTIDPYPQASLNVVSAVKCCPWVECRKAPSQMVYSVVLSYRIQSGLEFTCDICTDF